MLIETLKALFDRDLRKLRSEIEQYKSEHAIWRIEGSIPNSAGNLTLHLVGNLNGFIGATLGNTGYVRQRELEFSLRDIPRAELIRQIEDTIAVVHSSLDILTLEDLVEEFPVVVFGGKTTTTEYMLVHLATHLGYHLGQVNYHRRLLDA
jgi:hypothetical protein